MKKSVVLFVPAFMLLAGINACPQPEDADGDGFTVEQGDCDDTNPAVNPAATEICNGTDDNCDGVSDEGLPVLTSFPDADGDAFGDSSAAPTQSCAVPAGNVETGGDCDDADAAINPAAAEVCNGTDDNCNGASDEGLPLLTSFPDADGDAFGDSGAAPTQSCAVPAGNVETGGDCDDTDAAINPGAVEACNNVDDNCDGQADEGLPLEPYWPDSDGDGFGDSDAAPADACAPPSGFVEDNSDCDDGSATVNPAAEEICNDGLDNNCDDEGCLIPPVVALADADVRLLGAHVGDNAGRRVASAGDVNGDGITDFVISGHLDDTAASNAGAAYLFYGPIDTGAISLADADATFYGEAAGDNLGFPVQRAGDVNGDGVGDILIGAFLNDQGGTDAGAVYLFHGPLSGVYNAGTDADAKLIGQAAGDNAGRGIAAAGDLNNDGFADIVIGAPGHRAGARATGAAYVVHGPINGQRSLSSADAKFTGQGLDHKAGLAVARAGDVNGDGLGDLLIGASGYEQGGVRSGAAYVVQGPFAGTSSLSTAAARIVGQANGDSAGWSVASAGDVNGDGLPDVLVGAPLNDQAGTDTGATYVFTSPLSGVVTVSSASAVMRGARNGDRFGISVVSPGDVDGDGAVDILIGANREDTGGADSGAVYLYYGPVTGTLSASAADSMFTGVGAGDYTAQSVAGAGDVNGDGYPDLLIGAALNDASGSNAGAAYIVFGLGF